MFFEILKEILKYNLTSKEKNAIEQWIKLFIPKLIFTYISDYLYFYHYYNYNYI